MDNTANRIELCGVLASAPEYSHENHGRRFFRFYLDVERLSGAIDTLPVIADEQLLALTDQSGDAMLRVEGQVRSFNNHSANGRKLLISVYAKSILRCDAPAENNVMLNGVICREPTYRTTPLGREICDVMLAVNRQYRRADYLPCIIWGRSAKQISLAEVGTRLSITGRLQSREYVKLLESGSEKRIAYEISAISAEICTETEKRAPEGMEEAYCCV